MFFVQVAQKYCFPVPSNYLAPYPTFCQLSFQSGIVNVAFNEFVKEIVDPMIVSLML